MGIPQLTLQTMQVDEIGDTACEVGQYTMKLQPPGGEPVTDIGNYVVVWKRQSDDSWKLAVDIWNTNSPLLTG
jgi:ketosteroid isomerase-like protein